MVWYSRQYAVTLIRINAVVSLLLIAGILCFWPAIGFAISIPLCVLLSLHVLTLALFYRLEIAADRGNLCLKLGIGLISRTIRLSDIHAVRVVGIGQDEGWGIKSSGNYTLFSVGGENALELTLKGNHQRIRIGMDDPAAFVALFNKEFVNNKFIK